MSDQASPLTCQKIFVETKANYRSDLFFLVAFYDLIPGLILYHSEMISLMS